MDHATFENAADEAGTGRRTVRVLHVTSGAGYGGVDTVLFQLASLREACPELVPSFAFCREGRSSSQIAASGCDVFHLGGVRLRNPWSLLRANLRLISIIRRHAFDAVICHTTWAYLAFGLAAKHAGAGVFPYLHSDLAHDPINTAAAMIHPDGIISASEYVSSTINNRFSEVSRCVFHCPYAVGAGPSPRVPREQLRSLHSTDTNSIVICQVSRMAAWKGQRILLQALKRLSHCAEWVCWFVGGPLNPAEEQYLEELRREAASLGFAERVRFLGQITDVSSVLNAIDIYCQPNSSPEPFGLTYIEALVHRKPVVATALGGALEILDPSCAILTEPKAELVASALETLLKSELARVRLGEAGPHRVRRICDPARQLKMLYGYIRTSVRM